jgi:hypothetical protein
VPNGHVDTVVVAHQNLIIFLLKINFFICFGSFWCGDLKNDFKKMKKNHFDAFQHEKHFEKQPQSQPHSQTWFKLLNLSNVKT